MMGLRCADRSCPRKFRILNPCVRSPLPQLLAIATAVPSNVIEQSAAAELGRTTFGDRMAGYTALSRVFASTGIERRYSVEPLAWFNDPRLAGLPVIVETPDSETMHEVNVKRLRELFAP